MKHLSMSSLRLKAMYFLVLALTLSATAAFSLVANGNEFRFRTSSTRMHELPKAFSFRMNYRMGTEEDNHHLSQQHTINPASLSSTTTGGRMPKTVVHSSPASDQDQDTSKKVDEYLEFLDKRYHRIHDNDGGSPQQKKKSFSVLKWLAQENHTEPPAEETDALYALGVAGLASERLLQKHGVPSTKRAVVVQPATTATASKHDSIVVDYESSSEEDRLSLLLNKIFATMAAKLVSLQRQVAKRRSVMLKVLLQTSTTAGKATLAKLPRATRDLARALVKAGGGKRNLKIAATVTCAFAIYFAQPLIKGAITRSTQV